MKIPWLVWKTFIWFAATCGVAFLINFIYPLSKYSLIIWAIVVAPLLFLFRKVYTTGVLYLLGLEGENDIKSEFSQFPSGYTFLRNIETENQGNLDYVILGPTGMWVVEVKSHHGNITFNGDILLRYGHSFERDFLKQTYRESKVLEQMIQERLNMTIPVQPILVFSSPKAHMKLGQRQYKGVYVIQRSWLRPLITKTNGKYLTDDTNKKIVEILKPLCKTLFTEPVTYSQSTSSHSE